MDLPSPTRYHWLILASKKRVLRSPYLPYTHIQLGLPIFLFVAERRGERSLIPGVLSCVLYMHLFYGSTAGCCLSSLGGLAM